MEVRITRNSEEQWIERYLRPRYPELEAEYRRARQAFGDMLASGTPDAEGLRILERAASSRYGALWDNATQWLAHLTTKFSEPVAIFERMSRAPESHVRFAALVGIGSRAPRATLVEIVLRGIADRHASVRWKAVEKAQRHRVVEALPVIERQRLVERSEKVRRVIDFELPLLRDGYSLETVADGHHLIVSGRGGVRSGVVSEEELEREGVARLVAQWRDELDRDAIYYTYE